MTGLEELANRRLTPAALHFATLRLQGWGADVQAPRTHATDRGKAELVLALRLTAVTVDPASGEAELAPARSLLALRRRALESVRPS